MTTNKSALEAIMRHRYAALADNVADDVGLDFEEVMDSIAERAAEDELYGRGIHLSPITLLLFANEIEEIRRTKDLKRAVHLAMDIAGAIPGYGEPIDIAKAILYLAWDKPPKVFYAFLSLLCAVPVLGWFALGGKVPTRLVAANSRLISSMIDEIGTIGGLEKHVPQLRQLLESVISGSRTSEGAIDVPIEFMSRNADSAAKTAAGLAKTVNTTKAARTIIDELGSMTTMMKKKAGNVGDVVLFRGTREPMEIVGKLTTEETARMEHLGRIMAGHTKAGSITPDPVMREFHKLWTKERASGAQFFTDVYEQARHYAASMGGGKGGYVTAIRIPQRLAEDLKSWSAIQMPGPHGFAGSYALTGELLSMLPERILKNSRVPGMIYDGAATAAIPVIL